MKRGGRLTAIAGAIVAASACVAAACSPAGSASAKTPPSSSAPAGNDTADTAADHASAVASDPRGESVTVRYWVAGCSVAEDLWKYRKSSTITCDARGRTLASTHGVMAWPDYLMAEDIDYVAIEGEGLAALRFELEWSADDTFAPERRAKQQIDPSGGAVRFALDGDPEWRGLIRRFRLTWTGEPPPGSRIVAAWGRRHVTAKPSG